MSLLEDFSVICVFLLLSNSATIELPNDYRSIKPGIRGPLVKAITSGSKLALESCRIEFRWEKWNCPLSSFTRRHEEQPTKEIAFVGAIQSAGVAYQVSKTCSLGAMPCGCRKNFEGEARRGENRVKDDWLWGQCTDYMSFGVAASERFFDSLENNADLTSQVKKHNEATGAQVIKQTAQPVCHCHGVFGSCTMKTCWAKLAPFPEVSKTLKKKYLRAQRVQGNRAAIRGPFNFPSNKLIFLAESPNYCKPNATVDWPGTGGRICTKNLYVGNKPASKAAKRSCHELCRSCGHQVKRRPVKIAGACNCTLHSDFDVKCQTCQKTIVQTYCDDRPVKLNK